MRDLILAAVKDAGGRIRELDLMERVVSSPRELEVFYGCVLQLEDERVLVQQWPYLELTEGSAR